VPLKPASFPSDLEDRVEDSTHRRLPGKEKEARGGACAFEAPRYSWDNPVSGERPDTKAMPNGRWPAPLHQRAYQSSVYKDRITPEDRKIDEKKKLDLNFSDRSSSGFVKNARPVQKNPATGSPKLKRQGRFHRWNEDMSSN